jgi:hypothetical protein
MYAPAGAQVHWELWSNTNDWPSHNTNVQRAFIKKFKSAGRSLQIRGLVDFQPHYMIWVCQQPQRKEECASQCIRGGRYCVPDPDDNIREGYSGADVLKVQGGDGGEGGSGAARTPGASERSRRAEAPGELRALRVPSAGA